MKNNDNEQTGFFESSTYIGSDSARISQSMYGAKCPDNLTQVSQSMYGTKCPDNLIQVSQSMYGVQSPDNLIQVSQSMYGVVSQPIQNLEIVTQSKYGAACPETLSGSSIQQSKYGAICPTVTIGSDSIVNQSKYGVIPQPVEGFESVSQSKYGVACPTVTIGSDSIVNQSKYGVIPQPVEDFESVSQSKYGVICGGSGIVTVMQPEYGAAVHPPEDLISVQQSKYGVSCTPVGAVSQSMYGTISPPTPIYYNDNKNEMYASDFTQEIGNTMLRVGEIGSNSAYVSSSFGKALYNASGVISEDLRVLKVQSANCLRPAMRYVDSYKSIYNAANDLVRTELGNPSYKLQIAADGSMVVPSGVSQTCKEKIERCNLDILVSKSKIEDLEKATL